ncbi:winged helix DNA-binding domain-containing protein [Longispora sp. K20-0274]|uniref:winged helix DNA-binding domain-containing protein n=1 Tax=Longispora sp. K20-0274 TaxID=3088255 RepID=UPI00399AC367
MATPHIAPEQRRARLGHRHLLAARAATPEAVTESLVALHATDPATVHLSACARLATPDPALLEDALYERRALVRMTGMRRTMFVVGADLAPVVHASTTVALAAVERRNLLKVLREARGWDEEWLVSVEKSVLAALAGRGEATAAELAADEPRLREKIVVAAGKSYQATVTISSRILYHLAMRDLIVRGRTTGAWTASQYRWRLAGALPDVPAAEARGELVRRWLRAFGPGTEADLKWWTGWTLGNVRAALGAVGAVPVTVEEGTGYVLPDDVDPVPAPGPWAALLPALDPTPMGWQLRDFYLDPAHRPALFDRSGNIGPTVWWNGRIVGGWAQAPDGEVRWRLLTDPGRAGRAAVEAEAERLAGWLGTARFTPSFRTPLERELST